MRTEGLFRLLPPMNLKKWLYRGGRPNWVATLLNRLWAAVHAFGVAPNYLVTLKVRGRRSGHMISLPLVMVVIKGERYLVSMLGAEADWVQNVKTAGGNVTLSHGRREEVCLEEVAADRRAPVLKAYLKRAPGARPHLPVDKDAPLSEFERVSAQFPVFRVISRSAGLDTIKERRIARARVRRAFSILIGLLAVGLSVLVYVSYRRDIHQARERVSIGSQIVQTPCGPIEYAIAGDGPPVLIVHGAGGGYDQGLEIGEPLVNSGFRVIAMSRFGYLRTPLPGDASASAQADAHACLLDALKISRAGIVGASAGAPSSMQFALRRPDRCSVMILMVPAAYAPRPDGAPPVQTPAGTEFLFDTALKSDFLFWAATRFARSSVTRAILATPPEVVKNASADEQARIGKVLEHILPVSPRRLGLLNDAAVTSSIQRYKLERIAIPTLVISAADDLFGTIDVARYTAERIPRARFIGYPSGGHLLVGRQKEITSEMAAFLK
jgi:2-hydroxy-6-oxonona-2,4-dienedioate hydrolase